MTYKFVCWCLIMALPWQVFSQTTDETVEEVVVTATPLQTSTLEMTQASAVLTQDKLSKRLQGTIGETVSNIPGIHSAYFGPAVGRPIIRGLDGARVGVLENNMSANDASQVSADHAVSIEPFLADRVEVLRGPATLLYGSDTIGGVVNVRTTRIHSEPITGVDGSLQLQGDSVADERFGAARVDLGSGAWVWHGDAFYRDSEDYRIPGFASLDEADAAEQEAGILVNSAVETQGVGFGVSYIGASWHAGVSLSTYDNDYGIPGSGHHHEEAGHEGEGEHDEGEAEEEIELVSINLEQTKIDFEVGFDQLLPMIEELTVLLSANDYQHVELEGTEVGTRFENDTVDGRIELVHTPVGAWNGVLGLQFTDHDFAAIGEEAFVPPSKTSVAALFLLEETRIRDWRLQFGLRWEDQEIALPDGRQAKHRPFSASIGAVWHFYDDTHLSMNYARAERAPSEAELFANGPHIATATFEIGQPELREERAHSFELGLRKHSERFNGSVSYFYNDFSDFIFLADSGELRGDLPVRFRRQGDAQFHGFEVEGQYLLVNNNSGEWWVHALYDTVDGELAGGQNLPRIAPSRFGLGLDWASEAWRAGLELMAYEAQDEVAEFEQATEGYTLFNLDLAYRLEYGAAETVWEFFLKGRNLDDQEARNHTSFLKRQSPLPGRNWVFGLRAWF